MKFLLFYLATFQLVFCPLGFTKTSEKSTADSFEFKFHFDPSQKFLQHSNQQKQYYLNDKLFKTNTTSSSTSIKVSSHKRGYLITAKLLDSNMAINGITPPINPILDAIQNSETKTIVSTQGKFINVTGIQEMLDKFRDNLPASAFKIMQKLMSADTIRQKSKNEWWADVESWLGVRYFYDDFLIGTSNFTIQPGLSVEYSSITSFEGPLIFKGKRCVKIHYTYSSDPHKMIKSTNKKLNQVLSEIKVPLMPKLDVGCYSLQGTGTKIVEISTLNTWYKTTQQTVLCTTKIGQESKELKLIQTKKTVVNPWIYDK